MDCRSSQPSNDIKHREVPCGGDLAWPEEEPVLINEIYYYDIDNTTRAEPETEPDHFVSHVNGEDIPFAEAYLEPLLPRQSDFEGEVAAQPVEETVPLCSIPRPELLFASAIKPSPDSPVGVTFKRKNDGAIYISSVKTNGLFYKSGLQSGDRLVAVNNVSCLNNETSLYKVLDLIAKSTSTVSLCVFDKQGEPSLVQSSVEKPKCNSKLGISFQMKRGALTVSKVSDRGLFSQSLLMPDHRVFYINGQPCDNMGSQAAVDLTASASRVTVISRARGDLATVLSVQDTHRRRWRALAMRAGVPAVALSAVGS